jgi:exonuclease III
MPRGWCLAGWLLQCASPWTCSGTHSLLPKRKGDWAILSLNVNRMASLGGLASLVRSAKPDIVFLQECTLRDANLRARASALGYIAHQSSLDPSRQLRQLVTLVKPGFNVVVTDLVPGNLQGVTVGQRSFLHVHAPSDSHPEDRRTRARIFHEVAPLFVTEAKSLPVVVGDFNCVQDALDTTINYRAKVCRPLQDFLATFPLVDVFRACHPLAREYTFRSQGWPLPGWTGPIFLPPS